MLLFKGVFLSRVINLLFLHNLAFILFRTAFHYINNRLINFELIRLCWAEVHSGLFSTHRGFI
jgi:hypothetical protein